ncbi:hypothetical protein JCGZ_00806 [Jatropha curcas]|uniref:Chlororespiratory reduction 41 n=1 Tax=Jatropha curcas TaxID=180498 RepID=A0A067L4N2_JATCU|nr:uncharacterized protein LOC105632880 [Jatropha curcas]KDP39049.1 hypothetical protein JCGZ_00806 [Jatropha curcas]
MASTFFQYCPPKPNPVLLNHSYPTQFSIHPLTLIIQKNQNPYKKPIFSSIKCTKSNSALKPEPEPESEQEPTISGDNSFQYPTPYSTTLNNVETFPIEKRRRSEILREKKLKQDLAKAEPPNFEIGWKRTKQIQLEKPKGYVIMDFLGKLEELMGKEFGSTALLAKTGEIVAERAREEAEVLKDEGKVEERLVTELFRVLKLMEMDLAMVKAAVKEETLSERLEQAKARCRQAILVANSF